MSKNIGIDLGTTNTVVCYEENGEYRFVEFGNNTLLPSAVYVNENNSVTVGKKAIELGNLHPERLIRSAKTHMAQRIKKEGEDDEGRLFIYPDDMPGLSFNRKFTPTDVAEQVLREVKKYLIRNEICSEDEVINTIITVPAYFESNQVDETTIAGERAGFKVIRTLSEPFAAAIAYVTENIKNNTQIFVVDFGGGTFDITLLKYDKNNDEKYVMLALDGDNKLGGDDIDDLVVKLFIDAIKEDVGVDLSSFKKSGLTKEQYFSTMSVLLRYAKNTKHKLSAKESCDVSIVSLFKLPDGDSYDFEKKVTRAEFDEYCKPIYDKVIGKIANLLSEGTIDGQPIDKSKINKVLLVGGSCYIPRIRRIVEEIIQMETHPYDLSNVVALGACILSNQIGMMADRGRKSGNNGNANISKNPVVEMLAFDLGIEVLKDNSLEETEFSQIIKRRSYTPCDEVKTYYPAYDYQKEISINVYERAASIPENDNDISKCQFYGSFVFDDFEPGLKNDTNIDVRFQFDESRRLIVTVTDVKTGSSIRKQVDKLKKKVINQRGGSVPMDIFLLLDSSTSMSGEGIANVKSAVKDLVKNMIDMSVSRVGIITFATKHQIISELTNDADCIIRKTNNISPKGTTYAEEAFKSAYEMFTRKNSGRKSVVIMLTDGKVFDEPETAVYARKMKNQKIRVITIGAGDAINKKFLEQIASSQENGKNDMYTINNMSELAKTFRTIIDSLRET